MLTSIIICASTFASCNSATNGSDTTKAKPQTFIERQQKAQERKAAQQAKQQEAREKREAENKAAWDQFNAMSDKEKREWINDQKVRLDRRDSIQAAKRIEMEKKWAKFNDMTMDEQVELLKERGVTPHIHQHAEGEHNHNHSHKEGNHQHNHQHGKKQPAPQLKDVKINNVPMDEK
jgi:hypothetical protein